MVSSLTGFSRLALPKPTEVYATYWRFAVERQLIFFKKLRGCSPPWTDDPILIRHKFTNAYRASDRVSQYLIKKVIYRGDRSLSEVFFRIILFKIFNRIETWELLEQTFGTVSYSGYCFEEYDQVLGSARDNRKQIFSGAYIMPSGRSTFGYSVKHRNYLKLLELMMKDEVAHRISELRSMRQVFELLRSYPTIGSFLAYQYATDVNYSELTAFSEMDFVMPGPGALNGIRKCFSDLGGFNEADIIRFIADRQEEELARLGLNFQSLWGRTLQLIDCQNLFCEVDKYARVAHPDVKGVNERSRIKQKYSPHSTPVRYWYPPKWEINQDVEALVSTPSAEHRPQRT